MKKILFLASFMLVAVLGAVSCEPDPWKNLDTPEIDLPEGTFVRNVDIHFLSTLTNACAITTSNATAINNKINSYMANPGTAIVDRADFSGSVSISSITASKFFFKAFALNKFGANGAEGSVIAYKENIQGFNTKVISSKCALANMTLRQIPVNVKVIAEDESVVAEYTEYKIDLNFNTIRLEESADIVAFAAADGALATTVKADENAIVIGTVPAAQFAALSTAVEGIGLAATELATGDYTLFLVARPDKWALNAVTPSTVNGNVKDYKIGLAWL